MRRISIDMDGVIANVYRQFITRYEAESGKVMNLQDIAGKTEPEAFPNVLKYVNSPGFFRTAPVMEGSQHVLEKLSHHYKIFIVSAAMEFPGSLTEKLEWLKDYFPFIGWQQIVFCGSKEIIKADIMIDDHFKNLDYFEGETFLFTQPHNEFANPGRHTRITSWQEIEKILLP